MDQTGCPPWYATDNILIPHPQTPCTAPILGFIIPVVVVILFKTYVLRGVWTFWLSRRAEMRKSRAFMNRHPVVPVLLTTVNVLFVVFLVLVMTNVASASNGGAMLLFSITCFVWAGYCLFHVKKYVGLGRRLIPLAVAQVPGSPAQSPSTSSAAVVNDSQASVETSRQVENSLKILNTFDGSLLVLVALMVLSSSGSVIVMLIPGLMFPQVEAWPRASFGLFGFFSLFLEWSLIYHLERLIRATKLIFNEAAKGQNESISSAKIIHAIKMMRISQAVWFFLGNTAFLVFLLGAIGVIDMGYILLVCLLVIETAASSFAYFATTIKAKTRKNQSSASSKDRGAHAAKQPVGFGTTTAESKDTSGMNGAQSLTIQPFTASEHGV